MQIHPTVSTVPPTAIADGTGAIARAGRYGELVTANELIAQAQLCTQGSYFKACNPTFGTGIAMGIQTTFSDTANVLAIMRTAGAGVNRVYPDFIRLICTAIGGTTTSSNIGIITDNSNRLSSGGTVLAPVNANMGSGAAATAIVNFGVVTATAVSAKRQLCRAVVKTQATPCWVLGDQVVITFGDTPISSGLLSGAAAGIYSVQCPPVVLGPAINHSLLVHMWNPGNATTPPSWECEFGWYER